MKFMPGKSLGSLGVLRPSNNWIPAAAPTVGCFPASHGTPTPQHPSHPDIRPPPLGPTLASTGWTLPACLPRLSGECLCCLSSHTRASVLPGHQTANSDGHLLTISQLSWSPSPRVPVSPAEMFSTWCPAPPAGPQLETTGHLPTLYFLAPAAPWAFPPQALSPCLGPAMSGTSARPPGGRPATGHQQPSQSRQDQVGQACPGRFPPRPLLGKFPGHMAEG